MKRSLVLPLLLVCNLFSLSSFAQKEDYNWYFGYGAGINFNTSPPSAVSGNTPGGHEGYACISDKSGKLLFYTNGISVYNKDQVLMPNGDGLHGDESTSQTAIVQKTQQFQLVLCFLCWGARGGSKVFNC